MDLLAPERVVRRRAENAVSAMFWGAPVADATAFLNMPNDVERHRWDWGLTVNGILNDPTFDGARFVAAAFERMRGAAREESELLDQEEVLWNFDNEKELSPEQIEEVARRRREHEAGTLPNSLGDHTLHQVIEHAGDVLLRVPDAVRAALGNRACTSTLADALRVLGPAAVAFAPDFLMMADPTHGEKGMGYPTTLAAIAKHDLPTIRVLLERVSNAHDDRVAYDAAATLGFMGRDALRVMPSLVDRLIPLAHDAERRFSVLGCISKLGADREDVLEIVLAAARPAPPRLRSVEGFPEYKYDEVMQLRGTAIEGLAHFQSFSDRVVPVLMNADRDVSGVRPRLELRIRRTRARAGVTPSVRRGRVPSSAGVSAAPERARG